MFSFLFLFFHLCLTLLLFLASSGDRGTSHTTSNSSKDSSSGIANTNLHQTVGAVSATTAVNSTTASATSLMSKALAGFGTGGPSKPKSSAGNIGAAVVAAAQAQAASEAKQQQQHQMAAAVQNSISSTRTSAAVQNSSPISAGRISKDAQSNLGLTSFIFTSQFRVITILNDFQNVLQLKQH